GGATTGGGGGAVAGGRGAAPYDVPWWPGGVDRPPAVTIASTLNRTNSVAISANRILRPSAQRYSIATVRPFIHPSSSNRFSKAAVHGAQTTAVAAPKNPMVGSRPVCCARADNGHAVAPPSSVMNWRRLMCFFARSTAPDALSIPLRSDRATRLHVVEGLTSVSMSPAEIPSPLAWPTRSLRHCSQDSVHARRRGPPS